MRKWDCKTVGIDVHVPKSFSSWVLASYFPKTRRDEQATLMAQNMIVKYHRLEVWPSPFSGVSIIDIAPNVSFTSSIASPLEDFSTFKLPHLLHIRPLLPLRPLQLDHILNVVLPQSLATVVDMRARLSQLRRKLNAPVDLFALQLQHPELFMRREEETGCDWDLAGGREVDEAVLSVERGRREGRGERRGRCLVEDLVPEGWGGHFECADV